MPEATASVLSEQPVSRRHEKHAEHAGAVAVAPDGPETAFLLGSVAARSGRHDEALIHFDEAIAQDAANPDYLFARAITCRVLDRLEDAAEDLRAALRLRRCTTRR